MIRTFSGHFPSNIAETQSAEAENSAGTRSTRSPQTSQTTHYSDLQPTGLELGWPFEIQTHGILTRQFERGHDVWQIWGRMVCIYLVLAADLGVVPQLPTVIGGIHPPALLAICWSASLSGRAGVVWLALLGVIVDSLQQTPLAVTTASFLAMAGLHQPLRARQLASHKGWILLWVTTCLLIDGVRRSLISQGWPIRPDNWLNGIPVVLSSIIPSVILGFPLWLWNNTSLRNRH